MTATRSQLEALVMRVQREFLNRPTLALTAAQAQRRFAVDRDTCEAILDMLVDARVLARTPFGSYVRHFPQRTVDTHAA